MTVHAAFCPHCGYDLRLDTPVLIDDYYMSGPIGVLRWCGVPIELTATESNIVYTLMKAYPKPVSHDAILERLGSEATGNVVDVYLSRVRKKIAAIGAPEPFKPTRHRGGARAHVWV